MKNLDDNNKDYIGTNVNNYCFTSVNAEIWLGGDTFWAVLTKNKKMQKLITLHLPSGLNNL